MAINSGNNTRVFSLPLANDNNVSSIGGGAGATGTDVPAAFFYTSNGCIYRKITSTAAGGAGFAYEPTTSIDMTAAATNTALMKFAVTDFGGLNATEGVTLLIGQGGNNNQYHDIPLTGSDVAGTPLDLYPAKGGFIILPVNPNLTAYHRATGGSASLNITAYFGLTARFASASAKAENLGLSCVDIGTGLELHTSGVLKDFYDADEGTQANRFGYATQLAPDTYNLFGTMTIGQSGGSTTATTVSDTSRETWQHGDGLFDAGWTGWLFDLGNASTAITLSNKTLQGIGSEAVVDTRPVLTVTGTAGSLTISSCVISNYASLTLTSAVNLSDSSIVSSEGITQAGAIITSCTFSGSPVSSNEAMITVADGLSNMSGCSFVSGGTGHAIEITTPGTYNWSGHTYSGYGANDTGNAVVYNNSGGLVTLTLVGGAVSPTVRNGTSASTNIVSGGVTIDVNIKDESASPVQGAFVYIDDDLGVGGSIANTTTDASGNITQQNYSGAASTATLRVRKYGFKPYVGTISLALNSATNITLIADPQQT